MKLAAGTWEGSEDLEFFYDLFKVAPRPYVLEIKKPASANQAAVGGASVEGATYRCVLPCPLPEGEGLYGEGLSMADARETFYQWRSSGIIRA